MLRLFSVPAVGGIVAAILVAACTPTSATPTLAPTQPVAKPTTAVLAPTATTTATGGPTATRTTAATTPAASTTVSPGDANAGKQLIVSKGCGGCHTVPGVPEAKGTIQPSLAGFAGRPQIAGALPNTPENLQKWLKNPPGVKPGTAMPNLNLSDKEISDLSAFLYSLK